MPQASDASSAVPQSLLTPLTRAAIFLVLTINPGSAAAAAVRAVCADLAALIRTVGFREREGGLCCVVGIGSAAWDRVFGPPRPAELHPFRELRAGPRQAPATPGDVLFHIRAERMDMCFELARLLMAQLGDAVATVYEVHGFRYFDNRDLLGFVDGTENPVDREAAEAALIGEEDPGFAGGSYVIVQKYLHDLAAWNTLSAEAQEKIIGRTKLDDADLDAGVKPTSAHNALTTIVEDGVERKIVRDNMPFGRVGEDEFGTYFIGYCRTPRITEQMLENMFVGRPPGNYDHILDFSRAVTGGLFFVPSMDFLEAAGAAPAAAAAGDPPQSHPPAGDGSLGIGALKGIPQHE
jgi:porphyrinogen peroxidase